MGKRQGERLKDIYITSLHLQHGGVEMAITLLANALVKREYNVTILCLYNLGQPVYQLDSRVKISYLTNVIPNRFEFQQAVKRKKFFLALKEGLKACKVLFLKKYAMIRAIKSIRNGVIISSRNEHSVLLSKYGNENVKKISQLHNDHRFEKKYVKDFKQKYGKIDIFVLLTEETKKEVEEIMKNNHHTKLKVIPNFLSEVMVMEHVDKKNQVIAVGRLHEEKGFYRMLEIWENIGKEYGTVLKIIGEGNERGKLEQKIKELGIEEYVVLTGALSHEKVMEEMRSSIMYLMTSREESFAIVLIEAMSAGLPLIAFDVRVGPRALIQDGVNGYLIPDGNKEIFEKKIRELLEDDTKRENMAVQGRKRVLEFTEESVMKMWTELL